MKYILLDDDISILPMPTRVYNALKRNKVNTVGEMIRSKEEGKLEDFAFLGKKGISEIEQIVLCLHTGTMGYCIASTEDEAAQRIAEEAVLDQEKAPTGIQGDTRVSDLPFSVRAANALRRLGIEKVSDLMKLSRETIEQLPGVGAQTSEEILGIIKSIEKNPEVIEENEAPLENTSSIEKLLAVLGNTPVDEVMISSNALIGLKYAGIFTIGALLQAADEELRNAPHIGDREYNEIKGKIQKIIEEGNRTVSEEDNPQEMGLSFWRIPLVEDGFDFYVIDLLMRFFDFKPSRMAKWFDLSKQGIGSILKTRLSKRRSVWTGKTMSAPERELLMSLIEKRQMESTDSSLQCICMNDMKGGFICLFVENKRVKCFFLDDLPEDLRDAVVNANLHRYTQRELDGESDGEIVYSIRKAYYRANNPVLFRNNAMKRGLTTDEYAQYLSGYPYFNENRAKDEEIIAFLRDSMVNGKVYLSSAPKNQWIRSLASRNGYSVKGFIELYGFEPALDGTELTAEGARERHIEALKQYIVNGHQVYFPTDSRVYKLLNTYCYQKGLSISAYIKTLGFERIYERPRLALDVMEQDMQVRQCDGRFEEKLFARFPLLGSAILSQDTLDKLNDSARKSIDRVLTSPSYRLSSVEEMRITVAMLNHAKGWNSEENSEFWKYISLQMGYRDRNSAVERIIRTSMEHAIKENGRLFVEDDQGRHFRNTALIHSLSPRKSMLALLDLLFEFYKTNLNWKAIPGDPLLGHMVRALQQKMTGEADTDAELTISSRAYSIQEGIRKLVLLRPAYARSLFERLIVKIDALVNNADSQARTYEELLCEEWFKEKLASISNDRKEKRQRTAVQREIALDYTRIKAKYILKDENEVQVVLPDIRLNRDDVDQATIAIYQDGLMVVQQALGWYGNELGKTLIGGAFPLPASEHDGDALSIQVRVLCDGEVIYDSEDSLYRRVLVFYGEGEVSVGSMSRANYTVVVPGNAALRVENADTVEIETLKSHGVKGYLLELREDFLVTLNDELLAFDGEVGSHIRIVTPAEVEGLPQVSVASDEWRFAKRNGSFTIILDNLESLRRYVVLMNDEQVDYSTLPCKDDGLTYTLPTPESRDSFELKVIDLENERCIFDRRYILIDNASCGFNRPFYYSPKDYAGAEYRVVIDDYVETVAFGPEDQEVRIPYRNGELHIAVPKVLLEESTGRWLDGSAPAWYVGNIPQDSLVRASTPPGTRLQFFVGEEDILYDGKGIVTLGNVLQSMTDGQNRSMEKISMRVTAAGKAQDYVLTRVCFKEQFLQKPSFWAEGRRLYWDQGGAFIGKSGREFKLSLVSEAGEAYPYKLSEAVEYVDLDDSMPDGNYRYTLSMVSGGLFRRVEETLSEGDCPIGDPNLFRFFNRRIVIDSVTDPDHEDIGHVRIKTCWIDQIRFRGVEKTSEGLCPVYTGVLYTTDRYGNRYNFSSDAHTNDRGVSKMMVNPVRIIYVSDTALCLANLDDDGFYYYHYYDNRLGCEVFEITDREYTTKQQEQFYSTPDLYIFHTERM